MAMKRLLITFISVFLACWCAHSQNETKYPRVDSQYTDSYCEITISYVGVTAKNTIVIIDYITPRRWSNGWIRLSANTIITSSKLKSALKIEEWGILDGGDYSQLEFDETYSTDADRKYSLVLIFPKLPRGVEVFNIKEKVSGGFFWDGIHINNNRDLDESDGVNGMLRNRQGTTGRANNEGFEMTGSGTGFAIGKDGQIATCYHVIADASKIRVRGINGDFNRTYAAKVKLSDKRNDVAILQIDDESFTSLDDIPYRVADQMDAVGDAVYVLGYPLRAIMGDEIKLTNGIISSLSGYQGDITSYQVSATVQPGNSGGPLFDDSGTIIGIVNARLAVENASYAIKSPYFRMHTDKTLDANQILSGKTLSEQVSIIKQFVYIIEVE